MHTGCGGERDRTVEPGHPHLRRGTVLGAGLHPGDSSTSCGVAVSVAESLAVGVPEPVAKSRAGGVPEAGALITPGVHQARIAEHR